MKKVIEGRLYNTDTAKELASIYPCGYNSSDFNYFSETLFQTKSGAYFLHGEGHGYSRYGVWRGNTGGWGEKIMPMTPDQAREWAAENLDGAEYAEIFEEPEEAEGKVPLSLTVSADFKNHLIKMREETGKSISQIVEENLK